MKKLFGSELLSLRGRPLDFEVGMSYSSGELPSKFQVICDTAFAVAGIDYTSKPRSCE